MIHRTRIAGRRRVRWPSNRIVKPRKTSTRVQACCAGNVHIDFPCELYQPDGLQHQSKRMTPQTHHDARQLWKQGHHLARGQSRNYAALHSNTIYNLVVSLKNSYDIVVRKTERIKMQSNYEGFLLHKLNHGEMLWRAHNGHKNEQRYSKNYGCY